MRYYLSGPMTGLPSFNYPYFNAVAERLRHDGLEVVNPAENFGGDENLPREHYMKKDVAHLLDCQAIVLLDGWQNSRGARLEVELGRQIGLKTFRLTYDYELEPYDPSLNFAHHEAEYLVTGDRNADYGHPLDDFERIATVWSMILGTSVTPEQIALCMTGLKLAREVHKPKRDNITDAHGYLITYQMVREERARRGDSAGSIRS